MSCLGTRRLLTALALAWSVAVVSLAQQPAAKNGKTYPPDIPEAKVVVYRQVGDVALKLWVLSPPDATAAEANGKAAARPAIVFFFGGGWNAGSPTQFLNQGKYLATRGMVAILADYRVKSRNQTLAKDAVEDARAAIRYVREHARELGVDPQKVVAAGGSAGGHLAACTAYLPAGAPDADRSSVPNALALFNPALALAPIPGKLELSAERVQELQTRIGAEPAEYSPYHRVAAGQPPAIIFHGKDDTAVPYKTAELYTAAQKQAGNRCELVGYEGQPHGFFNHGRGNNEYYQRTLRALDEFLASLGYVSGPPTLPQDR